MCLELYNVELISQGIHPRGSIRAPAGHCANTEYPVLFTSSEDPETMNQDWSLFFNLYVLDLYEIALLEFSFLVF